MLFHGNYLDIVLFLISPFGPFTKRIGPYQKMHQYCGGLHNKNSLLAVFLAVALECVLSKSGKMYNFVEFL